MFDQLGERLKNTLKTLRGSGRLSEDNISETLREVRIALLEADVALPVVREFIDRVRVRAQGREVLDSLTPGQVVIKVIHEELTELMGSVNDELNLAVRPPAVILLAGLQGAGKTTSAGKLATIIQHRERKKTLLVSTDIYRPAAIVQLQRVAESVSAGFYPTNAQHKPEDIAVQAIEHARKNGFDVVIIDTAGRLHVDEDMMQEVCSIHAAAMPTETLFVVDSMTGQDAVNSAQAFEQSLPLTGVILTKTDGDARGGAALSIRSITGRPIKFIGAGESMDALQAFHPDRIASRILGMGDVLSLVEEVEQKADKQKAAQLAKKLAKGKTFDLEDFRQQLLQMEQMGGMMSLMDKMPGMEKLPKGAMNQVGDQQSRMTIAIINSMTAQERQFPSIIRSSRKRRIATGSGARVQDVNRLLKQFTQTQKMMKRMRNKGGLKNMLGQLQGGGLPGRYPR